MYSQNENSMIKCNILLIGMSGAGKSSFANYLFGTDAFTTAVGLPETTWNENFQKSSLIKDDIEINVYDSVGLEHTNIEQWRKEAKDFLDTMAEKDNVSDILHAFFYVINAKSARAVDMDLNIINQIQNDYNITTAIVLSNCDAAAENEIVELEQLIKEKCHNTETIRVCSISKKRRVGESKPFGKEEAIAKVLEGSYEKVGKELLFASLDKLDTSLWNMRSQLKANIEKSDISFFNMVGSAIRDEEYEFDDKLEALFKPINDMMEQDENSFMSLIIPESHKSYFDFIENFPVEWQGKDVFEDGLELLTDFLNNLEENISLYKIMEQAMDDIEEGEFFSKVKAIFTVSSKAVFIKKTLKDLIDEMFGKISSQIRLIKYRIRRRG